MPGESTKRDVVRILGKPPRKGTERYVGGRVPYYAYEIEDGVMVGLAEDRVWLVKIKPLSSNCRERRRGKLAVQ